ncbi:MAG TPA: glycosyltransferase family 9 protein [Intrasporangium sp.]|uniref:glycosyltransferase family 9 protein n=1 Tax=Intrasporangium sp. TaxID=1925024 RepID=UPI002D76EF67|nr:glycosyltransferase family 9 protein [Intrasporangium sp.]HET7397589.1 glycosyltransferase family 9 protein [Intrasporangium sp.]
MPAVRAVARALPGHEVVLAAPAVLEPLVRLSAAADRLVPATGLSPLHWPGPPPDVAVNLHGKGPQSHRVLQALRPGRLVAFACREAGVPGPAWHAGEHEVRRWCRLVAEEGWPADPQDVRIAAPPAPPPVAGAVVVHPGAAHPSRRWPPERFAAVARWAAGQGWPVVVTGGAQERTLAEEVCRAAGLPPEAALAGRTDLAGLAALVSAARLLVCGDTGVAHLSTAYGTPSVLLFGPVPPAEWGPVTSGPHTVLWHGHGRRGDPWGDVADAALLRITVEEVVEAAGLRLAAYPEGTRAARPHAGSPSARAHAPG